MYLGHLDNYDNDINNPNSIIHNIYIKNLILFDIKNKIEKDFRLNFR